MLSMKRGIAICILTLLGFTAFISGLAQSGREKQAFDQVAFYKNNCVGCHGSKAQKKFNPDLPEGQMVDAILNGLPMETPPDMPAFAKKGINEERAKAIIAYMKSLRQ
jgi:mono/diheme cytochrome c family protein